MTKNEMLIDAITALFISTECDACALLADCAAPSPDDHDLELAISDTFHIALDHATRLIAAIRSILPDLCTSLEICPMHHCDAQICADDEIAECAHLR